MSHIKLCFRCLEEMNPELTCHYFEGKPWCDKCWYKGAPENKIPVTVDKSVGSVDMINKPPHYHLNGMDTFTFLKEGFPPEVFRGFCIGNIIKYTQRYQLKGGIEDLEKVVKYTTELIEWDKKNPSL